MIRVKYEPRSLPLGNSGLTYRDEGRCDVPKWRLSLDNRLDRQ